MYCLQSLFGVSSFKKKSTICLCILITDQGNGQAFLNYIKKYVSYWVVMGTNQMIVDDLLLANIPGDVIDQPWFTYEISKQQALKACKDKADYVMILDSSDRFSDSLELPSLLHADIYQIGQKDLLIANRAIELYLQNPLGIPLVTEKIQSTVNLLSSDPPVDTIIIPLLRGGLGNRLFQVAAAMGYGAKYNKKVVIYEKLFEPNPHHSDDCFFTDVPRIPKDINISYELYRETLTDPRRFVELPKTSSNLVLEGFFQNEKYFKHIKEQVVKRFQCPAQIKKELQLIYDFPNTAFLHIRRGDYVGSKIFEVNLDEYYQRAIHYFPTDTKWMIITDDVPYCRTLNFLPSNHCYPKDNDDTIHFWIMTLCNGGICANSTYSWWGAYLQEGMTNPRIGPNKTFNDKNMDSDDFFPAEFLIVKVGLEDHPLIE